MNIARSLEKPAVPRSKKRRRKRRLKVTIRFFVLLLCALSAGYVLYGTVIAIGRLWSGWAAPFVGWAWAHISEMTAGEWFLWINRFTWGAVLLGTVSSLTALWRQAKVSKWIALPCFTYCYAFLWYVLWLVLKSFVALTVWTEYGCVVIAILSYLYVMGKLFARETA